MVNNIKNGPVSTTLGIVCIIGTLYAVEFEETTDWVYNGLIGVGIGVFLLFIPDNVKGSLLENFLKKKS